MKYLTLFGKVRVIQIIGFLFIPLVLIALNDWTAEKSISEHIHKSPIAFTLLLTLVASLFYSDGLKHRKRRLNIVSGLSMLLLIIFDNHKYFYTHYVFAIAFFLGEWLNMVWYSFKLKSYTMLFLSIFVLISMLGILFWWSYFVAEWLAILPIAIVTIKEEVNKLK